MPHASRGLVGPARQFGIGHLYNPILWWLLAGAIAPVISWGLTKRYPNTWVEYINVPVALTGAIFMPPATGINFSSWFLFGFVFRESRACFSPHPRSLAAHAKMSRNLRM